MWRPGFEYIDKQKSVLEGYHRALCIRTVHHRGTLERPGLVMGLAPGGACTGMAYRIDPEVWQQVHRYLTERELEWYPVYRESRIEIRLGDGRSVNALTYLPETTHPDFLTYLDASEVIKIVAAASGASGSNADYLRETVTQLKAMNVVEPELEQLVSLLDGDGAC
jgi:glutathione-specific gamma-glutamylcyclotransferase